MYKAICGGIYPLLRVLASFFICVPMSPGNRTVPTVKNRAHDRRPLIKQKKRPVKPFLQN
jgi:hypothetical protein